MNRLDAVNEILAAISLRPVAELDTNGASLAADAERWLDREMLRIQSQGWHYNIRRDVDMTPDGDGFIIPDNDVIWLDSDQEDSDKDVALVGGKLYDKDNNTYVFTETVTIRDCRLWDFPCVPHPVRDYILKSAMYRFARSVRRERGLDAETLRGLHEDLVLAQTAAHQFDNDSSNDNMLDTLDGLRVKGQRVSETR